MKQTFTRPVFIAGLFFSLLAAYPASAAVINRIVPVDGEKRTTAKNAKINSSRNNHAVKIYPDPLKRVMHVVARETNEKQIDFFVFDLQGTLMQHYKMDSGDHEKLTGLERGTYMFQVFSGDEETAAGQFDIR